MEVYNFIIFQGILQEIFELGLAISDVAEPSDPLPFYLFVGVHKFVERPVYLMLHLLLDIEFEVSPVPSPDRYRLEPFQVRPEDGPIGSQYCILVQPDIVEIQSAVCSITVVA